MESFNTLNKFRVFFLSGLFVLFMFCCPKRSTCHVSGMMKRAGKCACGPVVKAVASTAVLGLESQEVIG